MRAFSLEFDSGFMLPHTTHLHVPMLIAHARDSGSLYTDHSLGFLPAAIAAGSAAGPVGTVVGAVVGVIGTVLSSLFGSAGQRAADEQTSGVWLQSVVDLIYALKAAVGNCSKTVEQATAEFNAAEAQFEAQIRTLKTDSVVESRLAHQTVDLKNLFAKEVLGFVPGNCPSAAPAAVPALPGYCPQGTYHPIEDPFACVPFPDDAAAAAGQSVYGQAIDTAKAALLRRLQALAQQPCPAGQARNPATGRCVQSACPPGAYFDGQSRQCLPIGNCPEGQLFNIESGQCVEPHASGLEAVPSWLWLVLLAAAFLATSGNQDGYYPRRRVR